jgi:RNA polymerase sigma-70 factor (ECF subfamily)
MSEPDRARESRFDDLFNQHLPDITAYCRWRSRTHADAEDAVSEVFLTLWRRLDHVGQGSTVRAWLYATARRVTANQLRASRRRLGLLDRLAAQPAPPPEFMSCDADGPATDRVHAALSRLRKPDREVLLLAEWEGLSPSEIATVTGCSATSARGRLFRARRRFRETYETAHPDSESERATDPFSPPLERLAPERSVSDA